MDRCPLTKAELDEAYAIEGEQRARLGAWQAARFVDELIDMEVQPTRCKKHRRTAEHWLAFFFPLTISQARAIASPALRRKIDRCFPAPRR